MSCPICLEDYKGKRIEMVKCQYCPYGACRGCQQRYLLQTTEDPHCMDCKRGWTTDFMASNFPLSFRNDTLRKHRRIILHDREKSMLPAMQPFVQWKREIDELNTKITPLAVVLYGSEGERDKGLSAEVTAAASKRVAARRMVHVLNEEMENEDITLERRAAIRVERTALEDQLVALDATYKRIYKEFRATLDMHAEIERNLHLLKRRFEGEDVGDGTATVAAARREFVMRCPADTCRGFLSSAHKCGTCAKWACAKCLECIGEEKTTAHTCKPESVESAKMIQKETRPCPKCGVRIFKIDGCDQMWCTQDGCNTAFSWNTGHVVTGIVHNPHYYEWLRRTGAQARETGDIPCGGVPGFRLLTLLSRATYMPEKMRNTLYDMHRAIMDFQNVRLPQYPARMPALANKDEDIAYLMNELTEEQWQRALEIKEARFIRKREIGQILQTLITAASDILNAIQARFDEANLQQEAKQRKLNAAALKSSQDPAVRRVALASVQVEMNKYILEEGGKMNAWVEENVLKQLRQLFDYTNDAFKTLGATQHMAVPQISDKWEWKAARILYRPAKAAAAAARSTETEDDA